MVVAGQTTTTMGARIFSSPTTGGAISYIITRGTGLFRKSSTVQSSPILLIRPVAPGAIMITTVIWICLWLISGRKAFSTVITVTGRLPWSATVVLARKQAIPGVGPGLILIMTGTSIFS